MSGCILGPDRAEAEGPFVGAPDAAPQYGVAPKSPRSDGAKDPAAAEFRPDTGFFLSLSAIRAELGGDFDGQTTFVGEDSFGDETVTSIPKLDPGYGGRLALGWRWRLAAVEASFERTRMNGRHANGSELDSVYASFDISGRFYVPSPSPRVKPSLVAGIALPFLEVEDGQTTDAGGFGGGSVHDVSFNGYGVNLGLGADFYVTRQWSIDLLALYRWTWFDDQSGFLVDESLPSVRMGRGVILGAGMAWTF